MATKRIRVRGIELHRGQGKIAEGISSSSAMYHTVRCPRQFGKSTLAVQLILYFALNAPGSKTMFTSPTHAQSLKVKRSLMSGIEGSGVVDREIREENLIMLKNGAEIYFKSVQNAENLRGYDIDFLICDEAASYRPDTFDSVLRPMLTVRGKKCVMLSTPKGKNFFHRMDALGRDESETRYASYLGSSDDNPYANKAEIADAKRALPDGIFRQEYLAEFVDGGAVFQGVSARMTVSKWKSPEESDRHFAGLDIGAVSDYTVLTIVNSKGEVVFSYRETARGMPHMMSMVVAALKRYAPRKVLVETNGIGQGVYDLLKKGYSGCAPFTTTSDSKREIIEDLIYDLADGRVAIPTRELAPHYADEMVDFGYEYSPKTRKVTYNSISGKDDCVISLALANRARRTGANAGTYEMA